MPDYYRHADLLLHASLSETYGNVLGEALWCGTPCVAFTDGMGVSSQIEDGVTGVLRSPYVSEGGGDAAFGHAVVNLIRDRVRRTRLGRAAARRARESSSPMVVSRHLARAFVAAEDHAKASALQPAEEGPRLLRWLTTLRHARSWTTYNGLLYLSGHLRSPSVDTSGRPRGLHPSLADWVDSRESKPVIDGGTSTTNERRPVSLRKL
jgi:hypothetical protein